ncbi:MAG: diadenylate cyclase CdaA [Lachnospiraceae bacterium]|nr:diadenylate cyclase CdaA [Lachnospiraceae bacterium]
MQRLLGLIEKYISLDSIPKMSFIDFIEILIIAFLLYELMIWIRDTRAWSLMRGLIVIILFVLLAYVMQMTTILWLVQHIFDIAIMAFVVAFQPELRKALDRLGRKNFISALFQFRPGSAVDERFSDRTVSEIIKASYEMSRVRTGALIVVAQQDSLTEFVRTGIELDSLVSSQLLINIFEHNTPLHDGAVIIRGNRIISATCYLPLSDNMALSKELGTRHRAGVGISEVTDSLTVIVSEETGRVSVAIGGRLHSNVDSEFLRQQLEIVQNKTVEDRKLLLWKGRAKQ